MELLRKYKYLLVGGAVGLSLATSILSFGFFKTLFVLICTAIGAGLGYVVSHAKLFK